MVYLPHFLKGQAHVKQGAVLRFIEKLNAYPYEKNKGLVGGILVLTLVCLYTSQNVRFNEDMMSLNYEPAHLKQLVPIDFFGRNMPTLTDLFFGAFLKKFEDFETCRRRLETGVLQFRGLVSRRIVHVSPPFKSSFTRYHTRLV